MTQLAALSSGAPCFHWSSVWRLFSFGNRPVGNSVDWTGFGTYKRSIYLYIYKRSHTWHCISENKPSHEIQITTGLTAPTTTVASIICRWKKSGTSMTLRRAVCLANISNWGLREKPESVNMNQKRDGIVWYNIRQYYWLVSFRWFMLIASYSCVTTFTN